MSDNLLQAIRVGDGVQHSHASLGAVVGFIEGGGIAAVVCAAVSFTGVGAVVVILGVAVFGSGLGEYSLKTFGSTSIQGYVRTGSSDTRIGMPMRDAARIGDKVDCHHEYIVSGVAKILINRQHAARVSESTRCDGTLAEGCETVYYGGDSVQTLSKRASGELDEAFWWGRELVDIGTFVYTFPKHLATFAWGVATNPARAWAIYDGLAAALFLVDKGLGYGAGLAEFLGDHALAKQLGDMSSNPYYKGFTLGVGAIGAGKTLHGVANPHVNPPGPPGPEEFVGPPAPPPAPDFVGPPHPPPAPDFVGPPNPPAPPPAPDFVGPPNPPAPPPAPDFVGPPNPPAPPPAPDFVGPPNPPAPPPAPDFVGPPNPPVGGAGDGT